MKKILVLLVSILALAPFAVSAQEASMNSQCANITVSIAYGSNGDSVSLLQNFLNARGYLSATPSGFFGNLTMAAVKAFQTAQGISATGFVGPLTRAAIKNIDCSAQGTSTATPRATAGVSASATSAVPSLSQSDIALLLRLGIINQTQATSLAGKMTTSIATPVNIPTTTNVSMSTYLPAIPTLPISMTMQTGPVPMITSMNPAAADASSTVYLYGVNFDQNSSVTFCDNQIIPTLISPNALSFMVPPTSSVGNCNIQIHEMNGTSTAAISNTFYFLVNPTPATPMIASTTPIISSINSSAQMNSQLYPGVTTTITGSNLPNNATVVINGISVPGQTDAGRDTITFVAPSLSTGSYGLFVEGNQGRTNTTSVSFIPAVAPTIATGNLSITLASSSPLLNLSGGTDLGDYIFTNTATTSAVITNIAFQEGGSAVNSPNPVLSNVYISNFQTRAAIANAPGTIAPGGTITFNSQNLFIIPPGASVTVSVEGNIISYQPAPTPPITVNVSLIEVSTNIPVSAAYPVNGITENVI